MQSLRSTLLALAALLATTTALPALDTLQHPLEGFGEEGIIVVADLPRQAAEKAIINALVTVEWVEEMLDPDGADPAGLGRLNTAGGSEPVPLDEKLVSLLERTKHYCVWSEGAFGPLGGHLNEAWGLHRAVRSTPGGQPLADAVVLASCDLLQVDTENHTGQIGPESRADLWGFAVGYAIDRGVEALQEHGATNGYIRLGPVMRAFGSGIGGNGWPVGERGPLLDAAMGDIWLNDQAIAIALRDGRALKVPGRRRAPYIDHRTGLPGEKALAVVILTDFATDAEALATSLFLTGNRKGQQRLSVLKPVPAALWLIGSGESEPLVIGYRWSAVTE